MATKVAWSTLNPDEAFQPRLGLNMDHVDTMVQALLEDAGTFDGNPIHVWKFGDTQVIVDGFHRYEAFKRAEITEVPVEILETVWEEGISDHEHMERARSEALQHAIKNNKHENSPLKRSRADNQNAIRLLLADPKTRNSTDQAIADLVGVRGPTVARIRKEKPEFQSEERIGSDGRRVNRERLSSNAGNRLRKQATSVALLESSPTISDQETTVDVEHDLSQTSYFDDATVADPEAVDALLFHEQFEPAVEASSHADLEVTPTALVSDEVEVEQEQPRAKQVDVATHSASDAAELRRFREHFAELLRLATPFQEMILLSGVHLESLNLQEFGKAMIDHMSFLNEQVSSLKQRLEKADAAATSPACSPKPITVASASPAHPEASADPEVDTPSKFTGWEKQLLDISPSLAPIIGRVREGMGTGRNWEWFANDRTWKKVLSLVGKQLRDEAAALIQSLLKGGHQG